MKKGKAAKRWVWKVVSRNLGKRKTKGQPFRTP